MIHLKQQVLFSLKNNEKCLWMSSAAVVIGALISDHQNHGTIDVGVLYSRCTLALLSLHRLQVFCETDKHWATKFTFNVTHHF